MAKMRGIVVYLKMGIVIWFVILYTVNDCIQWTETGLWVEFRVYAFSINDMFAIMYKIQFYCISYQRITNNQTTLQFSILSRIPLPNHSSSHLIRYSLDLPTNKQTNNQHKFHLHLMRFSLASLHHLQNSLFILHLTLSLLIPHSHSCSSSCTPPPNPAASSACLPAASPPADRTPPPSPTFHPLSLSYLPHDHQLLEAGHQQRRVHLHQRRVLRHLRSLPRFLAQTLVHSRQNRLQFLRGRSLQQSA